jgi:diguanylate cyclase (GGDEF)-like protein/PAS domain S-box-containing protein
MAAPTIIDQTFSAEVMLDLMPEHVNRFRVADHVITYCNAAWAALYDTDQRDAIGRRLDDFLSPDEMDGLRTQLVLLGPDNPVVTDGVARAIRGEHDRWLVWVDRYLPSPGGAEVLSVGRDVTDRHLAELRLVESETRFRDLADKSSDIVWRIVTRPTPHFDYVSPSVDGILGFPPEEFLDDFDRIVEITDGEANTILNRLLAGDQVDARFDLRFRHRDGSVVIGETSITTIHNGAQGVTRDVTELRRLQATTAELALRDPLTGLANRRLFDQLLATELARTERLDTPLAVAYIDLDRLKRVNDRFGHGAGDLVLQEAARRLTRMVEGSDFVARLGGDEFALVYDPTKSSVTDWTADLDRIMALPIPISDAVSVECTASIGVADTRTDGRDPVELLAAADRAMYAVKKSYRAASHVLG